MFTMMRQAKGRLGAEIGYGFQFGDELRCGSSELLCSVPWSFIGLTTVYAMTCTCETNGYREWSLSLIVSID
jgi:hypothetical protein